MFFPCPCSGPATTRGTKAVKERWEGVGEVREERVALSGGERHSRNELKEVPRCPGNSSFSHQRLGGEKVKQQSVIGKEDLAWWLRETGQPN